MAARALVATLILTAFAWSPVTIAPSSGTCGPLCEPVALILAAETADGTDGEGSSFHLGIVVAALVAISIVAATVMAVRQGRPEMPPEAGDDPGDGTSGGRDTSSR